MGEGVEPLQVAEAAVCQDVHRVWQGHGWALVTADARSEDGHQDLREQVPILQGGPAQRLQGSVAEAHLQEDMHWPRQRPTKLFKAVEDYTCGGEDVLLGVRLPRGQGHVHEEQALHVQCVPKNMQFVWSEWVLQPQPRTQVYKVHLQVQVLRIAVCIREGLRPLQALTLQAPLQEDLHRLRQGQCWLLVTAIPCDNPKADALRHPVCVREGQQPLQVAEETVCQDMHWLWQGHGRALVATNYCQPGD